MNLAAALLAWRALLGDEAVLTGAAVQQAYGLDTGGAERHVSAALRITDSRTLPEVMRVAQRYGTPVYPVSTGRNWGYGTALPVVDGCTIVDLSGLQRIVHFDAELGVVTVEPGVTQGMLADFLEAGGHPYMVPTTGAGPACSLVGNALERGYGITPVSDHFAAVTDIEAVLADGSVYRSPLRDLGGEELARLYKWGIGPYTAGLFSQGGFGLVTRMSILLARRPPCVMTCLFSLQDASLLDEAVTRTRGVLAALPGIVGGINLMNRHRVLAMTAPYPRDSVDDNGLIPASRIAAMGRQYNIAPWTGFATLYGTREVVAAAARELRRRYRGVASRMVFMDRGRVQMLQRAMGWMPGAWARRMGSTVDTLAKSLDLVGGRPNDTALPLAYWRGGHRDPTRPMDPARDGCGLLWFAPLLPMRADAVRAYTTMAERVTVAHGMEPLITLTSVGERLFDSTVPILFDRTSREATRRAQACLDALTEEALAMGCPPYRVGIHSQARLQARMPTSAGFNARLAAAVDPLGVMAPGRYAPARRAQGAVQMAVEEAYSPVGSTGAESSK
jgi:FAD/FMN-containing dehydrogenase